MGLRFQGGSAGREAFFEKILIFTDPLLNHFNKCSFASYTTALCFFAGAFSVCPSPRSLLVPNLYQLLWFGFEMFPPEKLMCELMQEC